LSILRAFQSIVNLGSLALGHHHILEKLVSKSFTTSLALYGISQYCNAHSTASSSHHLAVLVQYVFVATSSKLFAISVYGLFTAFISLA
jgi:predicted CDP-diglyceride synthetase/phosphatidate cytidylyltransferase